MIKIDHVWGNTLSFGAYPTNWSWKGDMAWQNAKCLDSSHQISRGRHVPYVSAICLGQLYSGNVQHLIWLFENEHSCHAINSTLALFDRISILFKLGKIQLLSNDKIFRINSKSNDFKKYNWIEIDFRGSNMHRCTEAVKTFHKMQIFTQIWNCNKDLCILVGCMAISHNFANIKEWTRIKVAHLKHED